MAEKNIQIEVRNATNTDWDVIYPQTKSANIIDAGSANGVATLDSSGKVPVSQLGNVPDNSLTNAKLGTDIKIGSLATLTTTDKSSVVNAVNEVNEDVATHLAETVSHVASFTRDISITGLQVIEVSFKVKGIIAIGTMTGTKIFSEGFWGENNSARALYTAPDENYYSDTSIITLSPSSGNFAVAYVQAIENNTITLNWQKSGSPTGTATIHLLCQTH